MREVLHDATQTLSGHHPLLTWIAMSPLATPSTRHKTLYMKLNAKELDTESTKISLEKIWEEQMVIDRDPRVNWELGWRVVKIFLKDVKKEWDDIEKNWIRPDDEIYDMRNRIGTTDLAQVAKLVELEGEVRRCECANATMWRIRSKSKWMKIGDAPYQYFLKLIQAKRIQESIKVLLTSNGRFTKDENEIL